MKSSGTGAVIEPLLALEREDLTGTLEFRARGVTTQIHARAGEVVYAEGGTLGETLGRMLVRCERLRADHFGAIIRRLVDARIDESPVQFGDLAVQYGFLTADELDAALTQQVKEKIVGCLQRGAGEWRFFPGDSRARSAGCHVVRTRPTLVEAAGQLSERRIEEILHLETHRFPELVAPASVITAEFELTPEEEASVASLDGTSSLHFILPRAESASVPTLIAALVLGGGVRLLTAPKDPSSREAPSIPLDFRTLRREAARAAARTTEDSMPLARVPKDGRLPVLHSLTNEGSHSNATLAVARPAGSVRSTRDSLAPMMPDADAVGAVAFERLMADLERRKPVSDRRRWPDPKDDEERRLMAESAFHRGRTFLLDDAAERALPGLHRAFELCTHEPEYELYVKWAQVLVNDAFGDERRRADLEALAVLVVRRDPYCELGFVVLGHCALHQGREDVALRFLERAQSLDPNIVDGPRLRQLASSEASKPVRGASRSRDRIAARGSDAALDDIVPLPRAASGVVIGGIPTASEKPTDPDPMPPDDTDERDATTMERPARPPGVDITPFEAFASSLGPSTPSPAAPAGPVAALFPTSPISSLPPPPARMPAIPSVPPAPLPPVMDAITVPMAEPLSPWLSSSSESARALVTAEEPPPPKRRRWKLALLATWIGSIGVTAAIFYFVGARDAASPSAKDPKAANEAQGPSRSSEAPSSSSVGPHPTAALSLPTTPTLPTTATLSTPSPTPSSSTEARAVAGATSTRPPTTATLRAPRAVGRRIFFDGHIIGEGGKDLTVPCGTHRVRVGSAGTERPVTLACGDTVTVE